MAKLKKHFHFSDKNQIWRILISETDKLVIETRDTSAKEVFFNVLNVDSGKNIISNLQLAEKFWVGIEKVYNDVIIFHKFAKPDMPGHRGLLVYDIDTKSILWESDNYAFYTIYEDRIYVFEQRFEGRLFYALDYLTGELMEEIGGDFNKINEIRDKADEAFPGHKYIFPIILFDLNSSKHSAEINKIISGVEIVGNVEYNLHGSILLMTYHTQTTKGLLNNNFVVYDLKNDKEIFREIVNKESSTLIPDAFFIYESKLFLLSGKEKLTIYKIVE